MLIMDSLLVANISMVEGQLKCILIVQIFLLWRKKNGLTLSTGIFLTRK